MLATIIAAWLVASQRKGKRNVGFWVFLLSNVLWVVWALHDRAYALLLLQIVLAALNIRGARKNDPEAPAPGYIVTYMLLAIRCNALWRHVLGQHAR